MATTLVGNVGDSDSNLCFVPGSDQGLQKDFPSGLVISYHYFLFAMLKFN